MATAVYLPRGRQGHRILPDIVGSPSPEPLDPATLSLSLWVRGPFTSSPWAGENSAGTSGANDLTDAGTLPVTSVTGLNGINAMRASISAAGGVSSNVATPTVLADIFSGSSWSFIALLKAPAPVGDGFGLAFDPDQFFIAADTAVNQWGINTWDGVGYSGAADTHDPGAGYLILQAYGNGIVAAIRTNSNPWVITPSPPIADIETSVGGFVVGVNSFAAIAEDGSADFLELMTSQDVFTPTQFDGIKTYINTRYALAL